MDSWLMFILNSSAGCGGDAVHTRMRTVVVLALLSGVTVAAQAPPQARRESLASSAPGITISGRVVADETGDPVANARVMLTGTQQTLPVVLTDVDGRFSVTAQAGRYGVSASKAGYATRESTPANAGPALEIRLRRGAALSGRVLDEFGDPVSGVRVAAQTRERSAADARAVAIGVTDDNGEYRLAGLPAESYVVVITTVSAVTPQRSASNQSSSSSSIQRTYYPGATTPAEAQALSLRPGDDHSGVDFAVTAPVGQSRLFSSLMPPAQRSDARASGVVRGRVVSADGRSLPRVQVALSGSSLAGLFSSAATTTDDDGQFELREVAPGRFGVSANKAGYTQVDESGQPVPPIGPSGFGPHGSARSFDLAAGEVRERVDVTLARLGALTGRLSDENGDPIQDASVQALQLRYEAGRRWLVPADASGGVTDDLGRYRIHDLAPGQYIVGAAVGQVLSGDLPGYARTFYPGSSNSNEAKFVSVGLSQEVAGIDFALSRARTATVAGMAFNPAGEPAMTGMVELQPSQRSSAVTYVSTGAQLSPDGTFEFRNVPPGRYVIQTHRGGSIPSSEGEFGALPVTVNGTDISGLVLQISSGSTITGSVTFDAVDRTNTPTLGRLNIEISPVPVDVDLSPQDYLARAEILGDGTFQMSGLNGPRRLQVTRVPPGWALKEIRVNGIDVTDQPLPLGRRDQSLSDVEVVLTDRISELSGRITDDRARPAQGSSLIVFSTDRDRWYPSSRFLRSAVAGEGGVFAVAGLPTDTYYVAAVERIPIDGQDGWQETSFLESLVPRSSTVTLGDEQKVSVTLRVEGP